MDSGVYHMYMSELLFELGSRLRVYDNLQEADGTWKSEGEIMVDVDNFEVAKPVASGSKPNLQILCGRGGGRHSPLSISSKLFARIMEKNKFPRHFVQSLCSNNGSLSLFSEHSSVDQLPTPSFLSAVIQTPNSPSRIFSCALRINILDGSARSIFFDTNIPKMDVLIDRLRLRQDLSKQSSLQFLSLLFEEYGYDCERWRRELDRDVVRLETKTGMTSRALAHTLDDQTLDYESLTKRLHRCHTDLIFLDTVQNFEACLGDFCKKVAVQLETMRQHLDLEASSVSEQNIFFQNVDYHLNQNELRRFQTTCLQKRIQTQMNVLYSLISQRDSRINLTVAHDSKTIAAAAMRDSKAMRTVAVLTLVFLPATLIASVFSTGIFNLRGANGEQDHGVVARLWWVFVLVCVLLTGTVLATWALYTRHKTKNEDPEKG